MESHEWMEYAAEVISALLIFAVGAMFGAFLVTDKRAKSIPPPFSTDEETIKVKRVKPSLRNPLRTYETRYEDFKTKRGLYEPVKPKGDNGRLEELEE